MFVFELSGTDLFGENIEDKKKDKDEFTINFQEKLKKLDLSKEEALEEYMNFFDVKIESILDKNEEELNLSEIIAKETTTNKVSVTKILDAIEDFYKLDSLIEDVQGYDFLTDEEKYIAIKFLKRETDGELSLVYPEVLLNPIPFLPPLPPIPSLKNNISNDELIEGFNKYMDLLKKFKKTVKKEKISGEVGLVLES